MVFFQMKDFYFRYVDDIVIAISLSLIKELRVLNVFNSFHPRLQFTIALSGNVLNFLDLNNN